MENGTLVMEFPINSTVCSLYRMISTAPGLSQWFCDSAKLIDNTTMSFRWSKSEEIAKITNVVENNSIRYEWEGGYWFEMRIETTELTNNASLIVTEYIDSDDFGDTRSIWEENIKRLRLKLGSRK